MKIKDLDAPSLGRRLEKLERVHRRIKFLVGLVLMALGGLLLMGQRSSPRVIEAERFVLRDSLGATRATLMSVQDGSVGLTLFDRFGVPLTVLVLYADGSSSLTFRNTQGKNLLMLSSGAVGGPRVRLCDQTGQPRLVLSLGTGNTPSFELLDARGVPRTEPSIDRDTYPGLQLSDASGDDRALIFVADDGSPTLIFTGPKWYHQATLAILEGRPVFTLNDIIGREEFRAP